MALPEQREHRRKAELACRPPNVSLQLLGSGLAANAGYVADFITSGQKTTQECGGWRRDTAGYLIIPHLRSNWIRKVLSGETSDCASWTRKIAEAAAGRGAAIHPYQRRPVKERQALSVFCLWSSFLVPGSKETFLRRLLSFPLRWRPGKTNQQSPRCPLAAAACFCFGSPTKAPRQVAMTTVSL